MRFLTGALAAFALSLPVSSALAADLPVKARPMPVEVWNWTGFYVGGNVGYSWGRGRTDFDGAVDTTTRTRVFRTAGPTLISDVTTGPTTVGGTVSDGAKIDGWLGGGQIGYNVQSGAWVWGLETDLQWTRERGGTGYCQPAGCGLGSVTASINYEIRWFGTLRARAGFLVAPKVLLYATGGLAYGGIDTTLSGGIVGLGGATATNNVTRFGWTIGGGMEAAMWDNWTFELEYLYVDYGRYGTTGTPVTGVTSVNLLDTPQTGFNTLIDTTITARGGTSTRLTDNVLRVGLNYHFAPGPVVARY
jgi:outer membrane immunogenic protein